MFIRKLIRRKRWSDSLGIGLLQQGAPKFVPLCRLGEHQLVVEGGDAVINDHIRPVAIAPKLKGVKRQRLESGGEMVG